MNDPPSHSPPTGSAPAEFFAVACESHFVQPERFAQEFPELSQALRAFFRQDEALD